MTGLIRRKLKACDKIKSTVNKKSIILFTIIRLIVFVNCITNNNINLAIIHDTHKVQPYNVDNILLITSEEFIDALSNRNLSVSPPLDLSDTILLRHQERDKIMQFLGPFKHVLFPYSVIDEFQSSLDEFNLNSFQLSDEFEKECKKLMGEVYEANIFLDWRSIDDIDTTIKKIEDAKEFNKKETDRFNKGILKKTIAAATTAAAVPLTGDVVSPYMYILDVGNDLLSMITSNDKRIKKTSDVLVETNNDNNIILSKEDKEKLNENLYAFSKFYCMNTFQLQLVVKENHLLVEGDKINYMWMINLIKVIVSNINMQIINEDKKENIIMLLSTKQRLNVLKQIIQILYDIVSFSAHSNLSKKIKTPTTRTFDLINEYFDKKMVELAGLLTKLKQQFPQKEEQLQKTKNVLYKFQQLEQELTEIENNMANQQHEFETNLTVENIEAHWQSRKKVYRGYFKYAANNTEFIGENLEEILGKFVVTVGKGPLGVIKGVGDLGTDLVWFMISSSGGWIISLIVCGIVLVSIGGALQTLLWMIRYVAKNIYRIISYIFIR